MRVPGNRKQLGIFYPSQINEMRSELSLGDNPAETEAEREDRAAEIIRRRAAEPDEVPGPHLVG